MACLRIRYVLLTSSNLIRRQGLGIRDCLTGTGCPLLSVDHPCSVSHDLLQANATTTL